MAPKLIVEVVGSTDGLERSFKKAGVAATGFGGTMGKLSVSLGQLAKGVLEVDVLQKAFQGLESAAHLGITDFVQQTKAAGQTAAVLKSTGDAANVTAKQVGGLALSLSNLSGQTRPAIQDAENTLLAFTNIRNFAGKGNQIFTEATKAVVDYAARSGKAATDSATIIGRALEDPASKAAGLSRAGVVLTKSQTDALKAIEKTSGVVAAQKVLISDLTDRYGGAAKAIGETVPGELNKLKNALAEIAGQIVGQNVSGVNSLLAVGVKWIQNAHNQAKIAHDVQTAFHDVGVAAKDVKSVFDAVEPRVEALDHALGGTKSTLEILGGTFTALKFSRLVAGFSQIGGGAGGASTKVGLLKGQLLGLRAIGTIGLTIAVGVEVTKGAQSLSKFLGKETQGFSLFGAGIGDSPLPKGVSFNDVVRIANALKAGKPLSSSDAKKAAALGLGSQAAAALTAAASVPPRAVQGLRPALATSTPKLPALPPAPTGGLTQAQKNSFFDSAISSDLTRAGFITNVKAQIGALQNVAGLIQQRIAKTKDVTRLRTLEDQLLSVKSQISGDQAQVASNFIASLQFGLTKAQATAGFGGDLKALDKIKAALQAEIKSTGSTLDLQQQLFDTVQQIKSAKSSALSAKDFKILGLTATGDDITPGLKRLRTEFANVVSSISGTSLDTSKVKTQLAEIKKVISDSLVPQDVRAKMQALLANLQQQVNGAASSGGFKHLSSEAFADSIPGLTVAQKKKLEANFSVVGAGGTVPASSTAFSSRPTGSGGVTIHGDLVLQGIQNPKEMEAALIKIQRRRSPRRRGPGA